jgi:hypothetical protein
MFVGTTKLENTGVEAGFLVDTLLRGTLVAVHYDNVLPKSFALSQNYPNPSNPATTIHFDLPLRSTISLVVYDMLGRRIVTLASDSRDAGRYSIEWDGRNQNGYSVSSGVYFYRLQAQDFVQVRKLIILR